MTALGGELLLGLRSKGRIDNVTVDEEEHVVLDLGILESDTAFVLLLDNLCQLVDDLIGNVVDMRAAERSGN